jgi:hypothetical protein
MEENWVGEEREKKRKKKRTVRTNPSGEQELS